MDWLTSVLGRGGWLPHGLCFSWSPALLWSMVASDATIAVSYFSIPLAIGSFLRRRGPGAHNRLAWLFSAFIFACGVTHLLSLWTIWHPDYDWEVLAKAVTAAISLVTAVALWRLIPQALRIPSVGQLQAAIGSLEAEVHRRKSAEEHLREIEQSLAVTLASIEAGFIATGRDGRVTRMNAVAELITGWSQAEAQGRLLWEVFARQDRPLELLASNPVEVMIAQGVTVADAHHVVAMSRDGARTEVEVKAALTRDGDGSVLGLAMVFRDMTRWHRAEVERQRLAAIVESSQDAIIGKTLDGVITSWNGAAQTLFGYSEAEALGQPVQMLIPPEREAEEMRILADLALGHRVPAFDTVRCAKDGRRLDVSVTISPVLDAGGRIVGAAKIARDLAHLRRAEAEREKSLRLEGENRQILEATRLKSQFLANISHELRTPLNAIIGFAELLHAGAVPASSPKHREFLGHIASSGRHLLQLINDVLDLSKVEAGKFEFVPEPVDLPRLVKEVGDVLETSLQRKRLALVVDIDPALDDLVLDPGRLKQVLYNYLSNAIKFTPEDGCVTVRARAEGAAQLRIEVEDTGIGIAEADLARLFVEFQQLDAGYAKQHPGTGLGLALTRRLVQAQGGRVGVRSTVGVGSVFHVLLPRRPGAGATPPGRHLLVLEDDPRRQTLMSRALTEAGFQVDHAASAAQAVAQAAGRSYHGITLGLLLPGGHGLAALDGIRREGPSRQSPVVGLTMPADTGTAVAFGVADVLCKPIRHDEVVAAMVRFGLHQRPGARVLVIDDDPAAQALMAQALEALGVAAEGRADGRQALDDLDALQPDAIILDLMMPGIDGFQVLEALAALPRWRDTPVFIWTSLLLTDEEYLRLARSARAVLGKGGGGLDQLMARLLRWRPPVPAAGGGR